MNEKILVIDDDPSILRLTTHILQKKGYQVDTATNGIQAMKKAMNESPDLIILDLMLPGLDGFEICDRLKNSEATSQVPILMLSAKARKADKSMASELGVDAYLAKPIDSPEFFSSIKKLLKDKPAQN